jgi:TatD DNase family protein
MLFDSHTHINNEDYTEIEREELAQKIEDSKVSYVIDVGFDLSSSMMAVKHAEKYSWCYAAVGCHPHEARKMDVEQLSMFKGLAKKEKVKAIGEIGLDYYRNHSPREEQQIWFRHQIQLANELKMPIVIHDRDANQDVLEILKEENAFSKERYSWFPPRKGKNGEMVKDARVLLHCYSGSRELAEQYVKLGATISIAGPITYKNNRKGIEVAKAIPIEFLLVETDAPYLTPEPFRGRQNMSPYVEYTAIKLAEIKDVSFEEVARITCSNAKIFFGIED